MGTVYEYKGVSYELPDGLTNEAALAKIKASLGEAEPMPQVQPEAETQPQPQERGFVDSLGRQIGLTTRAGVTGLSYPVNAVMDFIAGGYNLGANLAGSEKRMRYLSQEQQKGLTQIGLPEPENALERSVQAGAQSMASVPAIPAAGLMKNLVQQVPAAGTAGFVAQPTIEGVKEITNSDLAATIAGISLAALVGGAAGKTSAKITAETNPIVTMQDVQQRASRAYTNVDNLGIQLNQQGANTLLSQINNRLIAGRYLPENAPQIKTVLNQYQKIIGRGNVSFGNIDQMRQLANDLRVSPDQNIRRLAGEMTSTIDDYVAKLSPSDVSAGAGGIDEAVKTIMGARKDWRNLSRATTLQNILDVADARAANPNASEGELIRQGFINLAANKNKLSVFTPDEQNAIKSVAKGGSLDPILSFIAKFDPTRRNVLGTGAVIGAGLKPEVGIPLVVTGMGAEQMQNFLRARAAQKVQSGLLSGNIQPPPPDYSLRGVLSSIGLLNQ